MQRYFFHLNYLRSYVEDPEGTQLPDLEAAKSEARSVIRDLAADDLRRGQRFELWSIRITSEANELLSEVLVPDAINEIFPPYIYSRPGPDSHI